MGAINISDISVTNLARLPVARGGGDVLHGVRKSDFGFKEFGEAYFSTVEYNTIRGWKMHKEMTLNLVVPMGSIRFVVYDNNKDSSTAGNFEEIILSAEHYARLTVPPKLWVGFQGMGKDTNLLLNIANIPHNDAEVDHAQLKSFGYDWTQE